MNQLLLAAAGFSLAALACLALTPAVARLATVFGAVDHPDERRVNGAAMPRLGGLAVAGGVATGCLGVAAAVALADLGPFGWSRSLTALFAGAAIVFATGVLDDFLSLTPRAKLVGQALGALVTSVLGFSIDAVTIGYGQGLWLGPFAAPFTMLWLIGVTNAVNLIDGIDGLAAAVGVVAAGASLAAAVWLGHPEAALVLAVLGGTLVAFLRYNWAPARIFLGDSGSMLVGFLLAGLTVEAAKNSAGSVFVTIPVTALAFPILDTTLAIARRWLRGVPLSKADRRHAHHRLLDQGHSVPQAVGLIVVVALSMALFGLGLRASPPAVVALVAVLGGFVLVATLLFAVNQLSYHEFRVAGAVLSAIPRLARIAIRRGIEVTDLLPQLAQAGSLEEINQLLARHGRMAGFIGLEVAHSPCMPNATLHGGHERDDSVWRMELLLRPADHPAGDPWVLRVWGRGGVDGLADLGLHACLALRPVLAERIDAQCRGAAVPPVRMAEAGRDRRAGTPADLPAERPATTTIIGATGIGG
ncbi:MAG: MraY family glycosyltransferase [Gemmatimonadota bacterium]